ncbi:MAG: helix-turn-helix transcriptional regulator [Oscillospiraceae bacterium]|nr:helix-turn-helix transcriptional regulator [Oscillospiraceae bacterium]
MQFGSNLLFLRRKKGLTQEQLAQTLGVSRQTVSKWESGQVPELVTLMTLADFFSCTLDDLLRQDLSGQTVSLRFVQTVPFTMARYVTISPNAHADVQLHLQDWAKRSGLLEASQTPPVLLRWSFPYVSSEQRERFGLQGAAAAYVLPTGFQPRCSGPELTCQESCCYAVLTIPEPNGRDDRQVSRAIQTILESLHTAGIPKAAKKDCLPCFELRYRRDGISYADIFLQCRYDGTAEPYDFKI